MKIRQLLINNFSWVVNTFYWPWYVDIFIAIGSLLVFTYFGRLALLDPQAFDKWETLLSVFPLLYSTSSAARKINEDRKQKDNFQRAVSPFISNCLLELEKHYPEALSQASLLGEKVIATHFEDWKKFQNVHSIEYQLLETWLNNVADVLSLGDGDRILLKYVLVTSSFPYHFPRLVAELKNGDYQNERSPHNLFIRKLRVFIDSGSPLEEIEAVQLEPVAIEETINTALNTNSEFINDLLKEKKNREKIDYLLNKCFENAYTNAGSLNIELQDDGARKIVFLFKYDERFSILKRVLNQAIKEHLMSELGDDGQVEEATSKAQSSLEAIMYPLPFSKALADFEKYIEKLTSREKFAFIIYPEKFDGEARGWTTEKFMAEKVIPRAQLHQDEFNKRMVKEFPYLKKHQKTTLDVNYYLFKFSRQEFSYHASQDAIPNTIKRFLIRDILDSELAGDVVASQLVYLKQVINNLSISGLLFTENKTTQDKVRKIEKKVVQECKKTGLVIGNIYDLIAIGNQFDAFVAILHGLLHNSELKRKAGKKYQESFQLANTILNNAKEIVSVFNSIKENSEPQDLDANR